MSGYAASLQTRHKYLDVCKICSSCVLGKLKSRDWQTCCIWHIGLLRKTSVSSEPTLEAKRERVLLFAFAFFPVFWCKNTTSGWNKTNGLSCGCYTLPDLPPQLMLTVGKYQRWPDCIFSFWILVGGNFKKTVCTCFSSLLCLLQYLQLFPSLFLALPWKDWDQNSAE